LTTVDYIELNFSVTKLTVEKCTYFNVVILNLFDFGFDDI